MLQIITDAVCGQTITSQLMATNATTQRVFNVSTRKVGGIRFVKLGRFCFSFCVTRTYKAM